MRNHVRCIYEDKWTRSNKPHRCDLRDYYHCDHPVKDVCGGIGVSTFHNVTKLANCNTIGVFRACDDCVSFICRNGFEYPTEEQMMSHIEFDKL